MSGYEFLDRLSRGVGMLENQLPRIVSDPRAYPRETMILAVIAAIGVLIAAMALLLVREWVLDRSNRQKLRLRRRTGWTAVTLGVCAAVTGAVMVAVAWAPLLPAAGQACGWCHAPQSAVASWKTSQHGAVSCYGCHARAGLLGAIEAAATGAGVAFADAAAMPVDSRSCLGCHDEVAEGVIEVRGMSVRHSDMIAAGMECTSCHARVGHENGDAADLKGAAAGKSGRVVRPAMSLCLQCHDDKQAPARCETCHTASSPSDKVTDATPAGRTAAGVTCVGCHKPETDARCIDCHGLVMPHPATFFRQHAKLSWDDPQLCASCHETADSNDGCGCHWEVNDHGTYTEWYPKHGVMARQNGPGGCGCHQPAFCAKCHDSNPW